MPGDPGTPVSNLINLYFRIAVLSTFYWLNCHGALEYAGAAEIDNWRGGGGGGWHIFIYSCYAQLISSEIEIKILKSIVFTVCEQEYMNMCPPPNYRSSAASGNMIRTT